MQAQCALTIDIAILGQPEASAKLLRSWGFSWDDSGLRNIAEAVAAMKISLPSISRNVVTMSMKLALYLSNCAPGKDSEVLALLGTPASTAALIKEDWFSRAAGLWQALFSFAVRAYIKLGCDEDAAQFAKMIVSPEAKIIFKPVLVDGWSTLGKVAAKQGSFEEADSHFSEARKEAEASRLPMLELLVARDWKKHVLLPAQRDCSPAEGSIDLACQKMKKTRSQMECVL